MIRAIFFDIGNVLIELNWEKTFDYFHSFQLVPTKKGPDEIIKSFYQAQEFQDFERGEISIDAFFKYFCKAYSLSCKREEFIKGLNLVLENNVEGMEELLLELRLSHPGIKLYTLSNTNQVHSDFFRSREIFTLFDKLYLSQELGARKPEALFFNRVLKDAKLNPKNSVFFDDLEQNVVAARELGMHSFVVFRSSSEIKKILKSLI